MELKKTQAGLFIGWAGFGCWILEIEKLFLFHHFISTFAYDKMLTVLMISESLNNENSILTHKIFWKNECVWGNHWYLG